MHVWDPHAHYYPWLCDERPIAFRYGDYSKLRRRGSFDFPVLGVAACLRFDREVVADARLWLTAVSMAPVQAEEAERALVGFAQQLEPRVRRIKAVTRMLVEMPERDRALSNASVYLEVLGHVVVAWLWLDQLIVVNSRAGDFYEGKRRAADYFFKWELPGVDAPLDRLDAADTATFEMREAWF